MLGQAAGTLATALGPVGVALLGIAAAGVGVGMVIKSAVGAAADFQQSMANVASVTGGGAAELEALSNAAREAGASTVFSAMEAADAQYYLASAGMNTEQIVASLNDTLLLAGAGSLEMGRAAEIVTNSLSQFSMEAPESGRVANVLAAAASGSNTTVSQMGIAMNKVGPIANALGMSYEQTAASLMVLANAGIKGEEGGTMLRGVLASLMDISPKAAEALEEMGLSAEDVDPGAHSFDEKHGDAPGVEEDGYDRNLCRPAL
jgi:TP901 family phage tail tape measure protein